ncbi:MULTISPECIES: diguanylate cyclase [Exiguobacterium]|uniref:diguanylate cyclase n=1 Tax=Exiguobacterium TaxID=33986 RepID=UPI001BEC61EF|nr:MULTISPECIES: diguanylate cyclase [Exiguobacterium]MCT4777755.1 diguanylate cyclase [Exiguobacterium aquaticum]MCT4788438.1 diguanylate cyclase [Exiguobacterium mexicanum]
MLTIINSFFLDLCILFTLFTISFLPFRNRPRLTPRSPLKARVLLGVQTGIVALVLLANALHLESFLIDLRAIPISLAVLFGGWVSGTVAAVIFLIGRFFMVTDGVYIGFYLAVLSMIGLVLPISLLRLKLDNTRTTLLVFMTVSVIDFGIVTYYALPLTVFYPVFLTYTVMAYGGGCASYRLLHELRRHFENVQHQQQLARTDALTGIANRRLLNEAMANLNVEAKEYALILVDIDHFKRVNDTYGHDVGDDVLRELGMLLVAESEERHLVGRFGGEEFLIIMPNAKKEEVSCLAESIREKVSTFPFETSAGTLHITVSLGACHSNDIEVDSVLKHADEALYHAKESGRNRFILAS